MSRKKWKRWKTSTRWLGTVYLWLKTLFVAWSTFLATRWLKAHYFTAFMSTVEKTYHTRWETCSSASSKWENIKRYVEEPCQSPCVFTMPMTIILDWHVDLNILAFVLLTDMCAILSNRAFVILNMLMIMMMTMINAIIKSTNQLEWFSLVMEIMVFVILNLVNKV